MRVGLDLSVLRHGLTNGSAVYSFNLSKALLQLPEPPSLKVFFCAKSSEAAEGALGTLEELGAEIVHGSGPWRWSPDGGWWLPLGPPMGQILRSVDVFQVGEFHFPPRGSTPWVAAVHDLTALTLPQHHLLLNRALHRRRIRWIRRGAGQIISISHSTKADLLALPGMTGERIHVVPLARGHDTSSGERAGAEVTDLRSRYGLGPSPYVLTVGTLEPRKNQEALVRAFQELSPSFPNLKLVLAGGQGWGAEKLLQAVKESPARDRIELLGKVPSQDLPALYAGAEVFAFPSLYEGFGLPVLEAMAAGTPVLTSNTSSLPEVAGDAALLVDPHSLDSIRQGLERLLEDESLRKTLVQRGRDREQTFTWQRTAEETLSVYHEAIAKAKAGLAPPEGRNG